MLTTRPEKEHIDALRENIHEMVLDYLALGIDPEKSTIYLQKISENIAPKKQLKKSKKNLKVTKKFTSPSTWMFWILHLFQQSKILNLKE